MATLEERLADVEDRNKRVSNDKAWETSWTRRGLIASMTYIFAFILLNMVGHEGAWKHAFVPVMGYVVSTFSLPPVKEFWIQQRINKKKA